MTPGEARRAPSDLQLYAFGRTVRILRARHGMTQKDYAQLVGARHQHISAIERGRVNPSLRTVHAMAGALGL
ncbi:MAG TPA: helix-turn-helix domain-containing protein, partial [Conexibacter sp.]|nr:helix-turn-helix domain-containing protein [Conexibacter sp.]